MAIQKFLAPLNGQNYTTQPYVDDIFDPLFTRDVRNYYDSIYGNNPIGRLEGVASGYAQMWENALTGQKGILGPGMGILSTFGRSMDKADDFILGGLTEGVNWLGNGLGGSNDPVSNPIRNIFVEDENYEGTRLLAAMGNAMSTLSGNQGVKLDESDFVSLGDRGAGTIIDLATDPGIAGGRLAKLNPNTPVGRVGQFLDNYDNVMANIAGNIALPGGKAMVHNFIKQAQDVNTGLGAFKTGEIKDVKIKSATDEFVDNVVEKSKLNPSDAEWTTYEDYLKSSDLNFKTSTDINAETALNTLNYSKVYKETGKNPSNYISESLDKHVSKPVEFKKDLDYVVSNSTPKAASEILATPITAETAINDNILNQNLDVLRTKYHISPNASIDDTLAYLDRVKKTPEDEYLSKYLAEQRRIFRYTRQGRTNVISEGLVEPIIKQADDLYRRGWTPDKVKYVVNKMTYARERIIRKNDIISDFLASPGVKSTVIPIKDVKFEKELRKTLKHNIDTINKATASPVFELIDTTVGDEIELGYKPILSNTKIIEELRKVDPRKLDLQDITFNPARVVHYTPAEQELVDYFRRLGQSERYYANLLGLEYDNDDFVHLLMENSSDAAEASLEHYKKLGLDKDKLDNMLAIGQDKNLTNSAKERLVPRGAFGTINYTSGHMGSTYNAPGKYSFDIRAMTRSAFTDSYMKNTTVQTCLGILDNPTLTIKNRFDSVDTLKEALSAGVGNENLTMASLKLNDKGQIVGFKRYNRFNDADIQKAFNDAHCVLCPEDIVGYLEDNFIKNKKITPEIAAKASQFYKASILNNLAFPLGNFGDAFTKQSVELGAYFGDDATTAMANTAKCMKDIVTLNNTFDTEVMQGLRQYLLSDAAKKDPFFRKFTGNKNIAELTSGTIFKSPESTQMFEKYINEVMPDSAQRNLAIFYMDLCGDVDVNIGKFKDQTSHVRFNKDLADMNSMFVDNEYAKKSMVDRILYGDKNKGTWGLINHPGTKLTLGLSEDYIEPMSRGATYLNWLYHKGYSLDDLLELSGYKGLVNTKAQQKLETAMNEAINAMYATNFNYESTSKFQKVFAKFVPFPTFFLKNIAFWLNIVDKKPQIIDNIVSVQEGMWSGKDTKDEFAAEAKGRGAIPIGSQNKHLTGLVKPTPFNSMFGAFSAINDPVSDVAFRTNPLLRPITRHLQDQKDVKYRPYNTDQFQKNKTVKDNDFSMLAYMFHQLNPYDKYFNTYLRTPGKVANHTHQLSDFVPSIFQPDFKK